MFKVVWRFNLADFKAIPPYPGTDSPWGAQIDMEAIEYRPID